jgi:hypothetical protein
MLIGCIILFFKKIQVKRHIEVGAIKNILDKAWGDNYKLESIWKGIEIAIMIVASFCINKLTMRQLF